jgi:hypothetical protein
VSSLGTGGFFCACRTDQVLCPFLCYVRGSFVWWRIGNLPIKRKRWREGRRCLFLFHTDIIISPYQCRTSTGTQLSLCASLLSKCPLGPPYLFFFPFSSRQWQQHSIHCTRFPHCTSFLLLSLFLLTITSQAHAPIRPFLTFSIAYRPLTKHKHIQRHFCSPFTCSLILLPLAFFSFTDWQQTKGQVYNKILRVCLYFIMRLTASVFFVVFALKLCVALCQHALSFSFDKAVHTRWKSRYIRQ